MVSNGSSTLRVCAVNVWKNFDLRAGLVRFLLEKAFGTFLAVEDEDQADLVLTSVFPHHAPKFPEKSVALIWENVRPNYQFYARSISCDFDSYGGRNCRAPTWYAQVDWEGRMTPRTSRYERRLGVEELMAPREPPKAFRPSFCCYVSRRPHPHRDMAVEALSAIDPVEQFGNVANRPIEYSKYDLLPTYRFNICFENSIFPGYYTEKLIHAWGGGCVPLYWSDPWYSVDFNPKAVVNRMSFPTLEDFVEHVRQINDSRDRIAEIVSEPLLLRPPPIDKVVSFLRDVVD
jgi:hypothetical protein